MVKQGGEFFLEIITMFGQPRPDIERIIALPGGASHVCARTVADAQDPCRFLAAYLRRALDGEVVDRRMRLARIDDAPALFLIDRRERAGAPDKLVPDAQKRIAEIKGLMGQARTVPAAISLKTSPLTDEKRPENDGE